MKFFINPTNIHPSNKVALNQIVNHLKLELVNNINDADVIYSPGQPLPIHQHPTKKFIFGPHFSVFPNQKALSLNGIHNNAVYIQPSQPSVFTWVEEFGFKNIPVKAFPFPLSMDKYKPIENEKDTVLIYFKRRKPEELKLVRELLEKNNVKFEIVSYGSYSENDYQNILDRCKYVVCLGRHESQGFAIQSALVKNIPMLVWDVRLRIQEVGYEKEYANIKSPVTTVPYWSDMCGEKFYDAIDLESSYNTFISKLDTYEPRKFMKETVSIETCSNNFLKLVESIGT